MLLQHPLNVDATAGFPSFGDPDWNRVVFQAGFNNRPGGEVFDESSSRREITATDDVVMVNTPTMFGQGSLDMSVLTQSRLEWDSSGAPLSSDWTFSMSWLPDAFSGVQVIFNRWESSGSDRGFILRHDSVNDELDLLTSATGTAVTTSQSVPFTAVANTRYDIVVTFDATAETLKVWIVGTLIFDLTGIQFNDTSIPWRIGEYGTGSSIQSIVGQVDRIRVMDKAVSAPEATPVKDFKIQGHAPGIASWWTDHGIVLGDRLFLSTVDGGGAQHIWEVSPSPNEVIKRFSLSDAYPADDHNGAAIEQLANGDLIVAYTGHVDDSNMRIRIGPDIDNLGAETTLTTPGGSDFTYSQIHVRGSEVFVLTRAGSNLNVWVLWYSTDSGATWSSARNVFQGPTTAQAYIMTRRIDNDTLRVFCTERPPEGSDLWVADVDLNTGDISSGGGSLGNFKTGTTIPVGMGTLTVASSELVGSRRRLLDVSGDGNRVLTYISVDGVDGGNYEMLRVTDTPFGSEWTSEVIRNSGAEFDSAREYCGGAVFDRSLTDDDIIISHENAGTYSIQRYNRASAGSWTAGAVVASSSVPLIRPYSPRNASSEFPFYYQSLNVDYTRFDDFKGCYTLFP